MCSAALCWRGIGLQARVFYFVLQSTALLRVSLARCERLRREQRAVDIVKGECRLRVILCRSLTLLERLLFLAGADIQLTSDLCQKLPFLITWV